MVWRTTLLALTLSFGVTSCADDSLDELSTPVTQVHHQGGGSIDLLFVIDNSGSMRAEQNALAETFGEFIRSFQRLRFDFRIAITTTDAATENGALRGEILSQDTPNLNQVFAEQIQVGTNGLGVEQGFRAAQLALSEENLEGLDFVREGAVLAVVFVSDEDDQSFGTPETFYEQLVNRKGDVRRVKISAITGPDRGGCNTASPGRRYLLASELSGGSFESICQEDLGMPRLGASISGFSTAFDLVHTVISDIEPRVFIDGEEVQEGWRFENERIAFDDATVPDDCALIEIGYVTRDIIDNPGVPVLEEPEPAFCTDSLVGGPRVELQEGGCRQAPLELSFFIVCLLALRRRSLSI